MLWRPASRLRCWQVDMGGRNRWEWLQKQPDRCAPWLSQRPPQGKRERELARAPLFDGGCRVDRSSHQWRHERVHTRLTKPLLFMRIGHDATVRLAHGQKEDSVNMRRRSVYQMSHGVATSSQQVKEKWQRVWFIESTLCMWQCGLTLNVFRIGFVHFLNIGLLLM